MLKRFLSDEAGGSTMEYALIALFVALGIVGAVQAVSASMSTLADGSMTAAAFGNGLAD